ncbi:solute carrier organic anion transporter family member 4C1-like isoform X2 [Littorina saxatilis]|uniref:Solute carrier organic anion transporter family member n=3 Tax=Littorina saxatilis TaxID=31220 RepID=A0AAN9BES0_9CAEN
MNDGSSSKNQTVPEKAPENERGKKDLNPLHHIVVFVTVLCALGFVEGISVNGLPFINISSLQTRFELTSKDAGMITSSADIGAIVLVLLVSYYGGRSHRPRVTAAGGFMLAVGSLIFLMPHALVGLYSFGSESSKFTLCKSSQLSELDHCGASKEGKSASRFLPMFIVGQAVQGIGFTPVFTCGFAYIDDHATSDSTAVYIGITYAITALGVGMGYVVGGQLLSLWVDVGRVDTSTITIKPEDRRWVGAWWIGYVICSILYCIIAIILCFFPRHLPGAKSQANNKDEGLTARSSRTHQEKNILEILLSFPKAIFALICNPLYVLLVLVGAGDTLIVSGIAGFAPKIIEEKFKIKPSEAGLIMGAVSLVGGAGGLGLGGYLIRRFHVKLFGILKMCLFFTFVAALTGGAAFFISCPKDAFAGINSQYGSKSTSSPPSSVNVNAPCNSNCACTTRNFDPVCGQDGVTYFSACYAGCMADNSSKLLLKYDNCSCVINTMLSSGGNGTGIANGGTCSSACQQVWPFVLVLFFGILFTFLNVTPISMAILRCVPEEERSVGLGMQWVALRSMGTIPGPILTGIVLDSTCRLWQSTCKGQGSCWMYDSNKMSLNLFFWWVGVKVTTLCFLGLAYLYYKKKGHAEVDRQEQLNLSITLSPVVSEVAKDEEEDKDNPAASPSPSPSCGQEGTCVDRGIDAKKGSYAKRDDDAVDVDKKPDTVSSKGNVVQPAVVEPLKLDGDNATSAVPTSVTDGSAPGDTTNNSVCYITRL